MSLSKIKGRLRHHIAKSNQKMIGMSWNILSHLTYHSNFCLEIINCFFVCNTFDRLGVPKIRNILQTKSIRFFPISSTVLENKKIFWWLMANFTAVLYKWCTPMDPHIWPSKSRTTSSNIYTAAMWRYGMYSRSPAGVDER